MDQLTTTEGLKYQVQLDSKNLVYSDKTGWSLVMDEDTMMDLYFQLKEFKCYA